MSSLHHRPCRKHCPEPFCFSHYTHFAYYTLFTDITGCTHWNALFCECFVVMVSLVSIVGVVRMVSEVEMVSKVGWQTARGVSTNLWKSLCLILKAALIFFFWKTKGWIEKVLSKPRKRTKSENLCLQRLYDYFFKSRFWWKKRVENHIICWKNVIFNQSLLAFSSSSEP